MYAQVLWFLARARPLLIAHFLALVLKEQLLGWEEFSLGPGSLDRPPPHLGINGFHLGHLDCW